MEQEVTVVEQAIAAIRSGELDRIREETGLSRNHLANLLHIQPNRVKLWETGAFQSVKRETAIRILDFLNDFADATATLKREGRTWGSMVSQRQAAMLLGIGVYALDDRMGNLHESYYDLDLLGLWITRNQLERLR